MSNLYQRIPQRIITSLGIRGTSAVFAFLLSFFLIRLGSPARLGSFSVGLLTSQLVAAFCLFGMDSMLLRLLVRASSRNNELYVTIYKREAYGLGSLMATSGTVLTALAGIVLTVARPDLADVGASLLRIAPAVYLSCMCQLSSAMLRSWGHDARSQLVYMTLPSIVAVVGLLSANAVGFDVTDDVEYLYDLGALLSFLVAKHWVPHPVLRAFVDGFRLVHSRRRRFIHVSAPIQLANIANYLTDWLAIAVLSLTAPLSAVAALRVINQISALFQLLATGFEVPLSSAISMAHLKGDKPRLDRLMRRARETMLLATSPLSVGLLLLPNLYLGLFKVEGWSTSWALRLLVLAQIVRLWTGASASALNVLNGQRELIRASALGLVSSALFVIALTPWLGLLGAAIGASLALVSRSLLNFIYLKRILSQTSRSVAASA